MNETKNLIENKINEGYDTFNNLNDNQKLNENECDIPETISSIIYSIVLQSILVTLSYFIEFLNPFITAYSVGWLGKKELASSALSVMFANVTGWSVVLGLTSSLDTLCSQAYYAGDKKRVGIYAQRCFWLSQLICIPIGVLWWFSEILLVYIGQDLTLSKLCGIYLRWMILALPPFVGFECVKKFLQAQGIMHASFNILLFNLPLCILLNYLLVWHPITSLGFIGAPIALSITNWSMFILSLLYVKFVDGIECWGGLAKEGFKGWDQIFKLGLPSIIMISAEWWAYEIISFCSSYLSITSLAAQGAISNLGALFYQISVGLAAISSNGIGNNIGAAHPLKAKRLSYACLIVGCTYSLLTAGLVLILTPYLKSLNNNAPEFIKKMEETLPALALFQIGDVMSGVTNGVLRGMGRQSIGAKLNCIFLYLFGIPLGIVLTFYFNWDLMGLWFGLAMGAFTIGIVESYIILKTDWDCIVEEGKNRLLT